MTHPLARVPHGIEWSIDVHNTSTGEVASITTSGPTARIPISQQTQQCAHFVVKSDGTAVFTAPSAEWTTKVGQRKARLGTRRNMFVFDGCEVLGEGVRILFRCGTEGYATLVKDCPWIRHTMKHPAYPDHLPAVVSLEIYAKVLLEGDVRCDDAGEEPIEKTTGGFAKFRLFRQDEVKEKLMKSALTELVPEPSAILVAWSCRNPWERALWERRAML